MLIAVLTTVYISVFVILFAMAMAFEFEYEVASITCLVLAIVHFCLTPIYIDIVSIYLL